MKIADYDASTKMLHGFPEIKKMGAVSPNGEMTPFVWQGKLMRLELSDPTRGVNTADSGVCALIRDVESGAVLSRFGHGCYYFAGYAEGDTLYVTATEMRGASPFSDTIRLFTSRDLVHWESRVLLRNEGWEYFNTSLCKGAEGYVLTLEARKPAEYVGDIPFTCFFARSKDLFSWDMCDYNDGFPKFQYIGGPVMKYSEGYYYLIGVTELPCKRYTNYIFRTRDLKNWEVGLYNPVLMPDNADKIISPRAADLSPEKIEEIRTGLNINNSDVDLCEFNGKTYINYAVGNQLGFYYMAEAEYDGGIAEFLKSYFE